jgi:hypothetical protein
MPKKHTHTQKAFSCAALARVYIYFMALRLVRRARITQPTRASHKRNENARAPLKFMLRWWLVYTTDCENWQTPLQQKAKRRCSGETLFTRGFARSLRLLLAVYGLTCMCN